MTVVEDRPIMSVNDCLPVLVFYFWRKLLHTRQRGLSAIAEHLVKSRCERTTTAMLENTFVYSIFVTRSCRNVTFYHKLEKASVQFSSVQ